MTDFKCPSSAANKIRKCPHCKSARGVRVTIYLSGYQESDVTFNGEILNVQRQGTDNIESYCTCLNCGKPIAIERIKTDNL